MIMLTDTTEKRALENKVESERDIFRMVVKVVANHDDFMVCTKDYDIYFSEAAKNATDSDNPLVDKIYDIFRYVHTLKGSFSQLGMSNTASGLHELEAEISELSKKSSHTLTDLLQLIKGFDYKHGMEKDIALLQEMLGEDFISSFAGIGRGLVIDRVKLLHIEKKMLSILSPIECRILMPEIQKLRYKPFKDLLKSYPEYMNSLAERLGKQIQTMEISGGETQVDTEKYSDFAKSLTHIFRNALDHGIEASEDRVAAGKDELGSIICIVSEDAESIQLRISDDGYGIDIDRVKQKAVDEGLVDKEQMESLSNDEILNIIFAEGFLTKDVVNELSGRGIGLSAVLKEVDKLNGRISVSTKEGEGTEFCIVLPEYKTSDLVQLTIEDIMTPLLSTVVRFIGEQLGEVEKAQVSMSMERMDRAELKKYTAFSEVKGILEGRFVLSFDENLAKSFAAAFSLEVLTEGNEKEYIEDSISECLNIILGNSIKKFHDLEQFVIYTSPVTISSEGTAIRYPESDVWTGTIVFQAGQMTLSFASLRGLF
jgi:two-component system, chemotaxis family, sensor kinase CheA